MNCAFRGEHLADFLSASWLLGKVRWSLACRRKGILLLGFQEYSGSGSSLGLHRWAGRNVPVWEEWVGRVEEEVLPGDSWSLADVRKVD